MDHLKDCLPHQKLASEIAAEGQGWYDIDLTLFNTDELPKFDFSKLSVNQKACRPNNIKALTLLN